MGKKRKRQTSLRSPNGRELVILSVLMNGKLYGREIKTAYERRTREAFPSGSLYTTLDRMEEKGYVRSHRNERERGRLGPVQRYFRLTADGRATLRRHTAWTAAPGSARRRRR